MAHAYLKKEVRTSVRTVVPAHSRWYMARATKKDAEKAEKAKAEKPKTSKQIIQECAAAGVRVFSASELDTPQRVRRPTGIASIDVEIAGGWPSAAISNLWGPPGVGKTWLSWRTLAMQQQIWGDEFFCVYVSLGVFPDLAFARMHGLKIPYASEDEKDVFRKTYYNIHGSPPTEGEVEAAGEKVGNLEILFANAYTKGSDKNDKPMERLLQTTVNVSKTRACQMIVVDDVGGMPTKHRLKDLWEKKETKTADYATLLTQWVQRLALTMQLIEEGFNATSILAVSQVRIRVGSTFGGYIPVSSQCMDHLVATGVSIKRGTEAAKEAVGPRNVKWHVFKGKFGHGDGARGEYVFIPTIGMDFVEDLLNTAVKFKVVTKKASMYEFEDTKAHGAESMKVKMEEDRELYDGIYKTLMEKRCPGLRYRG